MKKFLNGHAGRFLKLVDFTQNDSFSNLSSSQCGIMRLEIIIQINRLSSASFGTC